MLEPTIAPTIACVVDTGHPFFVAINSQVPAEISALSIIKIKSFGLILILPKFTMPFRTVEITSAPAITAPETSKIAATHRACVIVRVFAPTLVPKLFATSFPPILNAKNSPKIAAKIKTILFASPIKFSPQKIKYPENSTKIAPKAKFKFLAIKKSPFL